MTELAKLLRIVGFTMLVVAVACFLLIAISIYQYSNDPEAVAIVNFFFNLSQNNFSTVVEIHHINDGFKVEFGKEMHSILTIFISVLVLFAFASIFKGLVDAGLKLIQLANNK